MSAGLSRSGAFVISLDFELMWGVRDQRSISTYGANILGARQAVPRLLNAFIEQEVACTWATVGLLFYDDKDELMSTLPVIKPSYRDSNLSPYAVLETIGRNEKTDPYHYGLSLVRLIKDAPGQEIGTHTFSHYYCLEPGQTMDAFRADLCAAKAAAMRIGVELKSIVFPRNQYSAAHVDVCREAGLIAYRGNEPHPIYRSIAQSELSSARRASRLIDSYVNVSGANASRPASNDAMVDVPASRFLRPWSRTLRRLEPLRLRRVLSAMRISAREGRVFHLWFHPHNFGVNQHENFSVMTTILEEYRRLRDETGWPSMTMAAIAEGAISEATGA